MLLTQTTQATSSVPKLFADIGKTELSHDPPEELQRYIRQMRFAPLGTEGQRQLAQSRVLICGCGALGSVLANTLARAGVGFIRIVDRDFLEWNNLQRQVLYTEQDVKCGIPKAIAAKAHLEKINSDIEVEAVVANVSAENIVELIDSIDCLVDGTDNFETRFLINDAAVKHNIPWVYGGCIGSEGQTMTILPGETPCLHCLMQGGPPPPGTTPTCDSAGILSPVINVIASLQALEVIKIISGNRDKISRDLQIFDLWENQIRQVKLAQLRESGDCTTCQQKQFDWLTGKLGSQSAILCGRNAVQLSFSDETRIDLESLRDKLSGLGVVDSNPFLLRASIEQYEITVFPDGRAIIKGTEDEMVARNVYAKYIGN